MKQESNSQLVLYDLMALYGLPASVVKRSAARYMGQMAWRACSLQATMTVWVYGQPFCWNYCMEDAQSIMSAFVLKGKTLFVCM